LKPDRGFGKGRKMHFGVMDHLDLSSDLPQHEHYENRLRLGELYDQAGFHCYHVTEHHCTPLGGGAAPSVFLAALAQRTKRLRIGTLVYALPAHHPLRLFEEICMVDQISGGRLDIGFGRGSVPMELAYFGIDPDEAREIYDEALIIIRQGLIYGRIDFAGRHFDLRNVPLHLKSFQKPMPPVWYGVHSTESAVRAARARFNVVMNEGTQIAAQYIDDFKRELDASGFDGTERMIGLARTVVVAPSDEEAMAIARRAHLSFQKSFRWLHTLHGVVPKLSGLEATYDELMQAERAIAGSPETVLRFLQQQHAETGANYAVLRFAFGDMSFGDMLRSVELFVQSVMPRLRTMEPAVQPV